ncbi:DNA-binding XRE family transcriptional regulator [Paenibacillus cellulosilyticus]|uniref:DNA-binding XRE family transcriptional regulator n=1 Tax=Paenibacillus cellulosilyticus TaxID=375489 RepID=A0A2V2YJR8_9BACL|nr:DNA-binding XRE family transcriptional regulator [Paenibacillus cellulosilyticus]
MAYVAGRCLLRERRLERNLSQQEVADLSGLSRSHISALETDRYTMTYADAMTLAKVLKCEPTRLYELVWR